MHDLQCAVTTAQALRAGEVPASDLRVAWLRRRTAKRDRWREVEEALWDSVLSLERYQDAERVRQDLVVAPKEAVDAWIAEEDDCDYRGHGSRKRRRSGCRATTATSRLCGMRSRISTRTEIREPPPRPLAARARIPAATLASVLSRVADLEGDGTVLPVRLHRPWRRGPTRGVTPESSAPASA